MCNDTNPGNVTSKLAKTFKEVDPSGRRLARVFRESFDQVYDGQHTGRFSISQLSKTESAHLGSIVEINIRREFDDIIGDGEVMDFDIAGFDVDCKYSKKPRGWMIPIEALGHYGMLCHANDEKAIFNVGFLHFSDEVLTKRGNRDGKRSVSKDGAKSITWLHLNGELPPNTLLQLAPADRERILSLSSGAKRLDELFRTAQEMIIPRGIVATVAQQKDYMRRIRQNGGSRTALQPEGIVILGDYKLHRQMAADLELPVPSKGESISVRLFPLQHGDTDPHITFDGMCWRKANPSDPIVTAPSIGHKS